MAVKFKNARANPPICWHCDKRLYAGGRSYVLVLDENGKQHPVHSVCATEYNHQYSQNP